MAAADLNTRKPSATAPKKELLHTQIRKKTLVVDFLLFAVAAKLSLLLTYYQVNKAIFRTHSCSICSHVRTFHVAEFPFPGISKVPRSQRGTCWQDWEGHMFRLDTAAQPGGSQSPLCNFRWQYILTPGDSSVMFHLRASPTVHVTDRSRLSQKVHIVQIARCTCIWVWRWCDGDLAWQNSTDLLSKRRWLSSMLLTALGLILNSLWRSKWRKLQWWCCPLRRHNVLWRKPPGCPVF